MTTPQKTGTPVLLPSLGENVTEATITRWLKAPGDRVEADEPLLEVATDKVDTELPSPVAGTILELVVGEDDSVAIDAVIAIVGTEADSAPVPAPAVAPSEPHPASTPGEVDTDDLAPAAAAVERVSAEPRAEDALALSAGHIRVERLPKIRQIIARRMLESLRTSAQLTTVIEADITGIARLRNAEKDDFARRTGASLSYLPFFAKAAVEALTEHPLLNSAINEDATEITYHDAVHLGIAVDSPKGLMVPVIRDAQHMTIKRLATVIAEAAADVRNGRITADALTGGTFTLTNTGSRGALFDTPILNQPQSAILGTGTVVERVVPHRDNTGSTAFGVRSMVYLAITYDHRIIDGADAARFLATIKRRLESGFTQAELR
jgi:2-oxoglutarate dehydrogenase E2 component (dihydrolipoamide succinyltransferase)